MHIHIRDESVASNKPAFQANLTDKVLITHVKTKQVLTRYTEHPKKMRRARGMAFEEGVPMEAFDTIMKSLDGTTLKSSSAAELSKIATVSYLQRK